MLQRKMSRILLSVLLVALFLPAVSFGEAIQIRAQASPNAVYAAGETIAVAIAVTHGGTTENALVVALLDPAASPAIAFGNGGVALLQPDDMQLFLGFWDVTEEELASGIVEYTAMLAGIENGEAILSIPVMVERQSLDDMLDITRRIDPAAATEGETVTVSYVITNVGAIDVEDIVITDPDIVDSICAHSVLEPGQSLELSYTFTADSQPRKTGATISYSCEVNGRFYEPMQTLRPITIVSKPGVLVTLTADTETAIADEPVTLYCAIENNSSVALHAVQITDPALGFVGEIDEVLPGGTQIVEKKVVLSGHSVYQFTITADRAEGGSLEIISNQILIQNERDEEEADGETTRFIRKCCQADGKRWRRNKNMHHGFGWRSDHDNGYAKRWRRQPLDCNTCSPGTVSLPSRDFVPTWPAITGPFSDSSYLAE